jgi:DNA/RNA endonuclease YhcR with UshA esterase domain
MKYKVLFGFLGMTLAPALALTVAPVNMAEAHHSAAQFDFGKPTEVTGVVKEFEARNPHTKLVLEIKKDDGTMKSVEFESHSRNNIYRRGWREGMVKVGEKVTIKIAPRKDGADGGYVTEYDMPDGTKF